MTVAAMCLKLEGEAQWGPPEHASSRTPPPSPSATIALASIVGICGVLIGGDRCIILAVQYLLLLSRKCLLASMVNLQRSYLLATTS
jgi:hypothetical protein